MHGSGDNGAAAVGKRNAHMTGIGCRGRRCLILFAYFDFLIMNNA